MNYQSKELDLETLALRQLDERELSNISGGILPALGALGLAFGLLSGVALLAYGAGYLYGKLTCDK